MVTNRRPRPLPHLDRGPSLHPHPIRVRFPAPPMYEDTEKVGLVVDGGPLPAGEARAEAWRPLGDRSLLAILALAVVLLSTTLGRIEGYLLADSVEYMDRAQEVARGGSLDPATVRSFAFSALMVPIFWVSELIGLEPSTAAAAIRLMILGLGLAGILVVARTGTRLYGRAAGLFAALFLAINPTFLQYGVEPLSGGAALLSIALALDHLTRSDRTARRGLAVGFWSGVALLMAFKTMPISGLLLVALVLRGRWANRGFWLAGIGAYLGLCVLQCFLDLWVYGAFGSSLLEYVYANVGGQLAWLLLKLHGLGVPGTYDAAVAIYEAINTESAVATTSANVGQVVRSLTGPTWYFEHLLGSFLVLPGVVVLGLGVLLGLVRRRAFVPLITLVLVANVAVLSIKASKSFRLWLPLLPMVALLAGLGLSELLALVRGAAGDKLAGLVGAVLLVATLVGGQGVLTNTNLTKYGAWWRGIEVLDAAAAEAGETWSYTSAYHWAVRFQGSDHLELTKLPHHMDRWGQLGPAEREETLAAIDDLDGFLAHRQILTQDPEIMRRVNARFEVADILYEQATFEELDVLYVLKKRSAEPVRTFFELYEGVDPGPYQAGIQVPHSVDFRRPLPDGRVLQMVLLGWDLETGLAGGELAWLTLHWYIGDTAGYDFTVIRRLTDPDDRALDDNQKTAYGALPTKTLPSGSILRESYQLRLPADPTRFGGPNARGDSVPCGLWMAITEFAEEGLGHDPVGLNPFQPSARRPIAKLPGAGAHISPAGYRWSADNLMLVGGVWLPVPDGAQLADDGRRLAP